MTVSATKTIASYSSGGDVFRFLDMSTKAMELETGVATNEPVNYAIRTTIEHAIFNMIHEGIAKELWSFKIEE
jgi:curli production assembly/transport component CsgG